MKAKKAFFLVDETLCYLNHGSYGAALKEALRVQRMWQERVERNCIKFIENDLPIALKITLRELAEFIGASEEDVALVSNATNGVSAILRSLPFKKGDQILLLSTTYPAIKNSIHFVSDLLGVDIRILPLDYSVDDVSQVVKKIEQFVDEKQEEEPSTGERLRLAVVDHIVSATGTTLPIEKILPVLRSRGIRVLVDGAHSVGQLPLNMEELSSLGCDFFVSNCHKWLLTPKGVAFLWCKKDVQHLIHPLPISHGYLHGFQNEFCFTATSDYSPYLSLPVSLRFVKVFGFDKLRQYNTELASWAASMLVDRWKTGLLAVDKSMYVNMVTVRLPEFKLPSKYLPPHQPQTMGNLGEAIRSLLRLYYNIEGMVVCVKDVLYVRISAQVYNSRYEYELLASAIEELASNNN
eukprot:TRINITY_DN1392_c0_g1_i2.p1 TRINITY_DN1392_c0_g1~~TRINITY_DN1392_c0_g1_i2.p1  ORF type:complete len:408 (+),score=98.70 TRINITY_DN1392_c0_g1_i2:420-1643(+)